MLDCDLSEVGYGMSKTLTIDTLTRRRNEAAASAVCCASPNDLNSVSYSRYSVLGELMNVELMSKADVELCMQLAVELAMRRLMFEEKLLWAIAN